MKSEFLDFFLQRIWLFLTRFFGVMNIMCYWILYVKRMILLVFRT